MSLMFSCSVMSDSLWPHGLQSARLPCLSLSKFAQTHVHELVIPSNYLILCHLLLFLSSIFPSIRVFFNESALCIRWPKYWSFSFSTSLSWPGIKPRAPVLGTQSSSHQTGQGSPNNYFLTFIFYWVYYSQQKDTTTTTSTEFKAYFPPKAIFQIQD